MTSDIVAELGHLFLGTRLKRMSTATEAQGIAVLIEQRTSTTVASTRQNHVTFLQGAVLNQKSCHWTATFIKTRLYDNTLTRAFKVSFQLK